MSPYLSVAILVSLIGIMLILPLFPAFGELRHKSDAAPLNVIQQHAGDIRHFAHTFAGFIKELEPVLSRSQQTGRLAAGTLSDKSQYLVLPDTRHLPGLQKQAKSFSCPYVVACAADYVCGDSLHFAKEIYARGRFVGGEGNQYRAILGETDIALGPSSTVLRWAHAEGELTAARDCHLYGRISAARRIRLQSGCSFLRLNAPVIELGSVSAATTQKRVELTAPAGQTRRSLYDGDFEITAGALVHGNVVTRGKLHVRAGARIVGSLKSTKDMFLEAGVVIEGSAISAEGMVVGRGCALHGPVIAERWMAIHSGTRFGSTEKPTTVSSLMIEAEGGVLLNGTLWARQSGKVVQQL